MDVWSWKVSKGHLTVFYTPHAPYADEETGFEVKIGGAYKFQVMRDFPDDESVVGSVPVCDCGNTTTTAPTPVDVTSSSSADMVATLPSAMASPDIPALLAFIKRSEDELRNLLSTLPISVLDESILDPRDCNISSMTVSFFLSFLLIQRLPHRCRTMCPNIRMFPLLNPSTSSLLITSTSISEIDMT